MRIHVFSGSCSHYAARRMRRFPHRDTTPQRKTIERRHMSQSKCQPPWMSNLVDRCRRLWSLLSLGWCQGQLTVWWGPGDTGYLVETGEGIVSLIYINGQFPTQIKSDNEINVHWIRTRDLSMCSQSGDKPLYIGNKKQRRSIGRRQFSWTWQFQYVVILFCTSLRIGILSYNLCEYQVLDIGTTLTLVVNCW